MPILDRLLAALACNFFAIALTNATGLEQFDESRSDPAEWTIAVYLDGDNDLEKFGLIDLNEMELGLRGDVNVIVLVDRADGYDTSDGDWKDARVYRVVADDDKSTLRSRVIARPGEINMGDPAVLESFLATTLKSFPAKRTALVLWNHGGGWQAHAVDHGVPGQEHGTDSLTLPQLSSGIRGALGRAGRETLDIVGFDMCLMAQYEVALELQGLTEVLVASQATEPGDGWPYDRVLPGFADARATTTGVAAQIVEQFDGYYREREEAITTLAAYDLAQLPVFSERFDRLLAKLEPALPDLWPIVSRSIFFAEGYAPRMELQRSSDALASIDLLDAFRRVELNARRFPARSELRALEEALGDLLITHKTSPLRRLSNGIAIYAPVTAAVLNEGYDELVINQASRWRHFIGQLHGLQAAAGKAPVIRDLELVDWKAERPVNEALPLNTHGVSYVVEGRDLLWMRGLQGEWDKNGEGLLVSYRGSIVDANWSVRAKDTAADRIDLMVPQFKDGANSLVTQLDGYRYVVSTGEKGYYATVDQTGEYMLVPIIFHHPEAGDLGGTIYFHPQWWYPVAVELEMPQPDGSIVYRQIKPAAEDEVTLLLEHLKKDGTVSYAQGRRIAWGNGPELLLGLHEPGTHVFGVTAEAIGGETAHAFLEYRVGEDPALNSFMQQGGAFELDDLLGTWEMVEAEALARNGSIVPNGILLEYERHPEKQALMISTMTAPQRNPDFAARELVYLDKRLLPHLRSFKIETVGLPDDPLGVEFSVNLVSVHMQGGRPVMLTRNTVSGLNYAFAKVGQAAGSASGGAPGIGASPQPGGFGQPQPPVAPSAPLTLDGVWQRQDGVVLIVQGNQFQVNQWGMPIDTGMFAIRSDVITTQSSYTGAMEQYRFALQGSVLTLQDAWGAQYVYQRLQ